MCPGIGESQHPTEYMRDLVVKRNAIVHGLIAFIPATFTLAHLYTSSLHSSNLYNAGNIFLSALLAYSALFMGKTLQQLVVDSDRMDTTKAVYESLYMLASAFDRLRLHKVTAPSHHLGPEGIFKGAQDAMPKPDTVKGSTPAWRSPWVLFNVFLAIAAQDDSRIWAMFSAWLWRFKHCNFMVFVPCTDSLLAELQEFIHLPSWWHWHVPVKVANLWKALFPNGGTANQKTPASTRDEYRVAYAYWLFSQDKTVRTITGSMVTCSGVAQEMHLAGCRSGKLYHAAASYIKSMAAHVVSSLTPADPDVPRVPGWPRLPAEGMGPIYLTFITRSEVTLLLAVLVSFPFLGETATGATRG